MANWTDDGHYCDTTGAHIIPENKIGSGDYISHLLGQKEGQYASKVAATSFFTPLILSAFF